MKVYFTDAKGFKKFLGDANDMQRARSIIRDDASKKFIYNLGTPVLNKGEKKHILNFAREDGSSTGYSVELEDDQLRDVAGDYCHVCNVGNSGF